MQWEYISARTHDINLRNWLSNSWNNFFRYSEFSESGLKLGVDGRADLPLHKRLPTKIFIYIQMTVNGLQKFIPSVELSGYPRKMHT
jgi:hypothetical protein